MPEFILTCCTTSDMPADFYEGRNIPYICLHYHLDGETYPDDLGKTIPPEEYYQRIMETPPETSRVSTDEYERFFEPFLRDGLDIVHISMSSGLSGSYPCAVECRETLAARYPERKIYIVDSLAASMGYGMLVDMAADLRDGGCNAFTLNLWLEENKLRVNHWFFTSDLSYYKRGGRISVTNAIIGTILNICPVMNVDKDGKLKPRFKIRGVGNTLEAMRRKMEELCDNGTEYQGKCMISHSTRECEAKALAEAIEEAFPRLRGKVLINSIGAVIGSHTGPGTVALFFCGKKRED